MLSAILAFSIRYMLQNNDVYILGKWLYSCIEKQDIIDSLDRWFYSSVEWRKNIFFFVLFTCSAFLVQLIMAIFEANFPIHLCTRGSLGTTGLGPP